MIEVEWLGMRLRFSLLFPAMVVVLLMLDQSGLSAVCIAASAMHEAGHFLALMAFRVKPAGLTLGMFGIRVEQDAARPLCYRQNVVVSLAGPMVNLLSFALYALCTGFSEMACVHLVLAVFNLLPMEPLDGGQALLAFLSMKGDADRAQRILFGVSIAVLLPLAAAGFYILIDSGYNFSLLMVTAYLCLLVLFKRKN